MNTRNIVAAFGMTAATCLATAGAATVAFAGPAATPAKATDEKGLTDSKILGVADAANAGEVAQATIASDKAQADSVKSFAKLMIKDHSAAREKGTAIAKELGLTPPPSPASDDVKKKGDALATKLRAAPEATFDRTYMEAQVREHEKVLKMIDGKLLPNADAPQLKALLEDMRTHVEHHLSVAQSTLKQL